MVWEWTEWGACILVQGFKHFDDGRASVPVSASASVSVSASASAVPVPKLIRRPQMDE